MALCRLYGLPLTRLTGEDGGGRPVVYAPAGPGIPAAHELVGQLARILTGAPAVAAGGDRENGRSDADQAGELPELDLALQRLEAIDDMVTAGQQPRKLPAIVRDLLRDGAALARDELEALAFERGLALPDGLTGAVAVQLLIADAFYDGFTGLDVDQLDELADQMAAAAGIRRGYPFFGKEVLAARQSSFTTLPGHRNAKEQRAVLLRQLPPLIVDLACRRCVPLRRAA